MIYRKRSLGTGVVLVGVGVLFVILGCIFMIKSPVFVICVLLGALAILWGASHCFFRSISITEEGIEERLLGIVRRRIFWGAVTDLERVQPSEYYDGNAGSFVRLVLRSGRVIWIPDSEYGDDALCAILTMRQRKKVHRPAPPPDQKSPPPAPNDP